LAKGSSRGSAVQKPSAAATAEATNPAALVLRSITAGTVRAIDNDTLSRPPDAPGRTSPSPNKFNPSQPPQTPRPRTSGPFAAA